ncbi:MAG: hypothetical protein RL404_651 [Pseudomonadota bacterium]
MLSPLFLTSPALAAPGDPQLPPVVVSASRFEENLNQVPAYVRVISSEEIQRSGAFSVPALLAQIGAIPVSGSSLGQLGLGANVDLGGYGVTSNSTTLVLLDGQRMNPPDSQGVSWEVVPLNAIERIEILHGAAGVQFGNGAVGGVINIITRPGSGTSVEQTLGSFNTLITNASYGKVMDDARLSMQAYRSSTDGWRENSGAHASSVRLRYTKDLGLKEKAFIEAYVSESLSHMPGGVLGQVGQGNQQAAKFNNAGSFAEGDTVSTRAGLARAISADTMFEGEISYRRRQSDLTSPYYATADSISPAGYVNGPVNSFLDGWESAFTPRVKMDLGNGRSMIAGYDLSRAAQWSSNNFGTLGEQVILANQGPWYYFGNVVSDQQSASLTNQSVYLTGRQPLAATLDLTAGARRQWQDASTYDLNKSSANGAVRTQQSYAANAFDVALNYRYNGQDRLYVKWSRSFRFANLDEFWGFDANMNRVFSGALKPQTADAVELGGDWRGEASALTLAVFHAVSSNEIRYDPATFANNNSADDIRRIGLLGDFSYRWSPKLTLSGGGKIQQTVYASGTYAGQTVGLVPGKTFAARMSYAAHEHLSLGAVASYVGRQEYDASPAISTTLEKMPAYWMADLYSRYHQGPWEVQLTVRNLAGKKYATYGGYGFVALPGGTGDSRYYYYPSDPRAVLITAKYNF